MQLHLILFDTSVVCIEKTGASSALLPLDNNVRLIWPVDGWRACQPGAAGVSQDARRFHLKTHIDSAS
jgi:hypothetical protein